MIWYEVTIHVDPAIAGAVEHYMRGRHIPEILATGCFTEAEFARMSAGRFRTRYGAEREEDLARYLREHTRAFRDDFQRHVPEGATLSRETWETIQRWP